MKILIWLFILVYMYIYIRERYRIAKITSSYKRILKVPDKLYNIPPICHQTWGTKKLSTGIRRIMNNNKLLNLNMKFKLYDDVECHNYIRDNFSSPIYRAYMKINPKYGAVKADFFRYCILYNEGGIYLDIKSGFTCKIFGNIITPEDICILDTKKKIRNFIEWRDVLKYRTHEQWLLMFCKGHNYLKTMIDLMVEMIENYKEPPSFGLSTTISTKISLQKERVLRLTGPDAFSVAIHKSIIFHGIQHREVDYNSIAKLEPVKNLKDELYSKTKNTHYSIVTESLIIDL